MSSFDRVAWSQGLFLQPQHFQQETRHLEYLIDSRAQAMGVHAWGYADLVIDQAQLALGRVALVRARGVLPDGTPFSMPDHTPLPQPYEVPADLKGERICLGAPLARPGVTDFDFGDAAGPSSCRYRVQDATLRDQTDAAEDAVVIQVGRVQWRLLRERDLTGAMSALGVLQVIERRADQALVVERAYMPPHTRLDAGPWLVEPLSRLLRSIDVYAGALSTRMGDARRGVSEIADFLMLTALNRHQPLLRQCLLGPTLHPQQLHALCLCLAGELVSFDTQAPAAAAHEFPAYRHDDLQGCFTPILDYLAQQLSQVPVPRATQVELTDRQHGFRTAVVRDAELLASASFVLGVHAQLPAEQLCQRFLAQAKLAPVERIREIVSLALPGMAMRNLPVAPRQLPYHAGHHYFEVDRNGELWKQFERSGNLALHVAGDFPGLELQLWAIRP